MHLLLELCHERAVGGEDDVFLLQLHRDQRLALPVVNKDVQIDTGKRGRG